MTILGDLAVLVDGKPFGDTDLEITGVSEIQNGEPGTITFLANPKYKRYLKNTMASAVIVTDADITEGKSGIVAKNPQLAFARILAHFNPPLESPPKISAKAELHPSATIGSNVTVEPFAVIGEDVSIGNSVFIGSGVTIGRGSNVGENTRIMSGAKIYHDCQIGRDALIHAGAVIGCDGFGFVTEGDEHHKIPQTGKVIIEDRVEIGANCTIDRATIGITKIGAGSKLDNLVHIAHNVSIGKGCLLTAQVAIAGSVTIGDYCIFAGQSGVAPHLSIGDRAVIAAKTGVTRSLEGGRVYAGMPAREIREQNKRDAVFVAVEKLVKRIQVIEETIKRNIDENQAEND